MPGPTRAVELHRAEVAGIPVVWRSAPPDGTPTLWLHGVPTSSRLWEPFLRGAGGIAPDLPGFGASAKRGDWDYTIAGYRVFLEAFLDHLDVGRFNLVVQDWGAVGLALAQAAPQRVERLVVFNCVPFLPGYEWHWVARIWRRRGVGELAMGATPRWITRRILRHLRGTGTDVPDELVDQVWADFDQGTQRAILRLYRSADPDVLAAAGRDLGRIGATALVVWGERDLYIPARFGAAYAAALPNARLRSVPDAGHWPWLDKPGLVEEVCAFVAAR